MYKVYFNNRLIVLSCQPDRLQKYALFHKFHDEKDLNLSIEKFLSDESIMSLNIYTYKIDHLWKTFRKHFRNMEAAGGVVLNSDNKILFIKRYGRWDLPKGHVEECESYRDCAVREVEEETGIGPVVIKDDIGQSYHLYPYHDYFCLKTTHWFLMSYKGNNKTVPQNEEGITSAEWISVDDLPAVISDTWLSLVDIIRKVRKQVFS